MRASEGASPMSSRWKLRALGSAFQVLCITHLPQIAAYADTHFEIDKRVDGGAPHDGPPARRRRPRRRAGADARREAISDGLRQSAREMLADAIARATAKAKANRRRRKRKAKGESRAMARNT
jgi:hypothetical protein